MKQKVRGTDRERPVVWRGVERVKQPFTRSVSALGGPYTVTTIFNPKCHSFYVFLVFLFKEIKSKPVWSIHWPTVERFFGMQEAGDFPSSVRKRGEGGREGRRWLSG